MTTSLDPVLRPRLRRCRVRPGRVRRARRAVERRAVRALDAAIPGGVNSSIRAFKAVGGRPYVVARAEGPYVWDVEGNRYIDLVQSYGAVILGHAHPAVTAALAAAAADGTSYGAPTPREMKLAEAIGERVPSCEQVRLMNSGTEATSTAVRLARGFTGRDRIVTFHGNFHGATDALLAAGGSGVATLGLPGTAGVPAGAVAETLVVPYNVVPELDDGVAAVIVEPVAANMGVVAPEPGFLDGLRAECDRVGALLIFDEVITGFRLDARRRPGASTTCTPDLTTFGKVIGGGLPIGAVGGRRDVMETLTPLGTVFHAGTLSGNPLATAAGLAALDQLVPDVYIELAARARHLAAAAPRGVRRSRVRRPLPGRRHAARDRVRRRAAAGRLRRRQAHRRGRLRGVLPGDARRGRGAGPRRLRGHLRRPRPRRRRARRHRRRAPHAPPARPPPTPAECSRHRSVWRAEPTVSTSDGTAPVASRRRAAGALVAVRRRHRCPLRTRGGGLRAVRRRRLDRRGRRASPTRPRTASTSCRSSTARPRRRLRHVTRGGPARATLTMTMRRRSVSTPSRSRSSPARRAWSPAPTSTKPCAVLAETLGDTIVWFALVPLGPNFRSSCRRSSPRRRLRPPRQRLGGALRRADRPQPV